MTPIQTNLAALGLAPLPEEVRVFVQTYGDSGEGSLLDVGLHSLEEIVVTSEARHRIWAQARERTGGNVSYRLVLEADGFKAFLSSDGDIDLLGVDLRTNYLNRVVSEWGKDHVLDVAGMVTDQAVPWMLDYVRAWYEEHPLCYNKDGSVREYHHTEGQTANTFLYGLKDFFRYQKETQFGDGSCGAVGGLWSAACWELFRESREYPYHFCY